MKATDLKEICLKGAYKYYDYLSSKPNGSVEEVDIKKIQKIDETTFKLIISKKIFDLDAIYYAYQGDERKIITPEKLKIKLYDREKGVLIVKAEKSILNMLSSLDSNRWKIIIDLKFLVQRVIDWYELNGNKLKVHTGQTTSSVHFDDSVYLEGSRPSDEQEKALKTIHTQNFSYIWGAPGTGKTKFVLSYAILAYLKQKKKVLVLAPTNVALEQVFTGILEVTDKAGIDRNNFIRLGYPSSDFAEKYGEICEVQGVEKELKQIKEQIKVISISLGDKTDSRIKIEKQIKYINNLLEVNSECAVLESEISDLENRLENIIGVLNQKMSLLENLLADENKLLKKKNSSFQKTVSLFISSDKIRKKLEALKNEQEDLYKIINLNEGTKKKLNRKKEALRGRLSELKRIEIPLINKIREVNANFDIERGSIILSELDEKLTEEIEKEKIYHSLVQEYNGITYEDKKEKLNVLEDRKKKLEAYSLESRLEDANVVGATLDAYLFRFKEKEHHFNHIFIDEAGYASVIKALTVFTSNTPITLLGDHKQLPPVCEISKPDIKKDNSLHEVFVWDQSAIFISSLWESENLEQCLEKYYTLIDPSSTNMIKVALTKTHRFGANLAKTLEKYVYHEQGFKSEKDENTEVILYNVFNPIDARGQKRLNEAEAYCIKKYLEENFKVDDSVAVLAPYRAQVEYLQKELPAYKDKNKIMTIHKSQGNEWETVLYSVCDKGNGRHPWFTDSTSKISNGENNVNTAISRAKKRLVLFCCKDEWEDDEEQLISGLINSCTHEIDANLEGFEVSNLTRQRKVTTPPKSIKSKSKIKGKDYMPTSPDEEWESKLLYWSKKKKPGYNYSTKKKAYWKKK
ncbi:AAA domain-containing protein [Marinifilum fragile]|uniref:AAA domain-containing protein n=1 Tax=Marinifilum fragile TaxID=570161 RepID=UPI002AA5F789|nr:AAA domain-containing protein [Marinifilum fragile]